MEYKGFKDRKIIDTYHSIERFYDKQRHNLKDYKNSQDFFKKVLKVAFLASEKIIEEYEDKSTSYGVYSLSTGITLIIDWRKDKKNLKDKKNHAIIITLPGIKKNIESFFVKKGTQKIIVEKKLRNFIEEILENSLNKQKLEEKVIDWQFLTCDFIVTFEDKKMIDSGIAYCFIVE